MSPSKTLVVIQPSFLPWRGYFQMIAAADEFVLYDDVQYDKHGWRNRNRIKTGNTTQWITLPIKTKGRFGQLIRDVEIDDSLPWRRKILGSIRSAYARAPYFDKFYPWLESAFEARFLLDLNERLTRDVCNFLAITTPITRSTPLNLAGDDPVDRLIQVCRLTGAGTYLSGPSAKAYITPESFAENAIELKYQDYSDLMPYKQMSDPFDGFVSIIDGLMCTDDRELLVPRKPTSEHESREVTL